MKNVFKKLKPYRCVSAYSVLLVLVFLNFSCAKKTSVSPKYFQEAHSKLANSNSGFINYTYTSKSPDHNLKLNVELYFIKENNEVKSCYIKQYDELMNSEYVYYNDTLFSFSNVKNKILSSQNFTLNPFEDRDNKVFLYLIDGSYDYLTLFLQEENYKITKPSISGHKNLLQGESFRKVEMQNPFTNNVEGSVETKILINKKTKYLHYFYEKADSSIKQYFPHVSEFEINSIDLYNKINPEVESIIYQKYLERR